MQGSGFGGQGSGKADQTVTGSGVLENSFLSNLLKLNEGIVCAGFCAAVFITASKMKAHTIPKDFM